MRGNRFMSEIERKFDVIIVGGGPAGLSAAHWCAELGLNAILIEKTAEFGGQLLQIYNPITNYLGRESADGREMLGHFLASVENSTFVRRLNGNVIDVDAVNRQVALEDGTIFSGSALIIATGVSRRRLNVPGEAEFEGRGILRSGARDKESVSGHEVVIVGGGDAALENALILSEFAAKVTVVHRRNAFTARAEFIEQARDRSNLEFLPRTLVKRITGDERLRSIELAEPATGREFVIPADALLVRIGVKPNTETLAGKLELDQKGYIVVDSICRTNAHGVFSVGDAACPLSPTITTAAGMGATAAKAAFSLLVR